MTTEQCDNCQAPATARFHSLPLCGPCAARLMLAHLQDMGKLKGGRLSADGSQVETPTGDRILAVTRYWGWQQPVNDGWAKQYAVVAYDEQGTKYTGRGGGPGKPVTMLKQPLPKRLRKELAR